MDVKDISATVLCPGLLIDGINDMRLAPPSWGVRMLNIQALVAIHG
jgi:hypothetical protein